MLVKPAPGLKIRDPELKDLLPEEGREVSNDNMYWHRRLRDGDVVLGNQQAAADASTVAPNTGSDQS
jgi:hypothetical protein